MRSVPGTKTASIWVSGLLAVCAGITGAFLGANRKVPVQTERGPSADKKKVMAAFKRMPLTFQENRGQADKSVRFLTRGAGYTFWMSPTSTTLALAKVGGHSADARAGQKLPASVMRMHMVGANPKAKIRGVGGARGRTNYLVGRDRSKWLRDIPNYDRIRYEGIYGGIDLEYYGNQQELEHDFVVKPGADPKAIRLAYEGVKGAVVTSGGELHLQTANGVVEQKRPIAYQLVGGKRREIASEYTLLAKNEVTFTVGDYDHSKPLVIDPVLRYSTYLGGSFDDYGFGIAVDPDRNVYVTGYTGSFQQDADNRPGGVPTAEGGPYPNIPGLSAFPTTTGFTDPDRYTRDYDLSTTNRGSTDATWAYSRYDAFVTKLNPDGNGLVFSSYIGSEADDFGFGVAVGSDRSVFLTGRTESVFWPLLSPVQANSGGGSDAYIVKLNSNGNGYIYSSYLGGSGFDVGRGIAVDTTGNAYVAGVTDSQDLPVFQAAQPNYNGGSSDAFVVSLNASGSTFNYCTYLGGAGDESGVLGSTINEFTYLPEGTAGPGLANTNWLIPTIPGFAGNGAFPNGGTTPTTAPFQPRARLMGLDYTVAVAVDGQGNAYVAGGTTSPAPGFPITGLAVQQNHGADSGNNDAFVTKYAAEGTIVYSTFLGGNGDDAARAIALDPTGAAYVTGFTGSSNFPTQNPLQGDQTGVDAFVTKISGTGEALIYSTYLGGEGTDIGSGIAVSPSGQAYVTGTTTSTAPQFPTVNFSQANLNFGRDAFVTKYRPNGTDYEYSTFVGGNSGDRGMGIIVDARGQAVMVGMSGSTTYPVTINSYDPSLNWGGGNYGGYPRMDAVITKLHSPPFQASDLTTTAVQKTSISLAWTDNSDNEDGFEVERRLAGGGAWNVVSPVAGQPGAIGANQVTFTSSGLTPTTVYQFRVRPFNMDGGITYYGAYSNQLTVSTLPEEPDSPTGFSAVALDTSRIRVTWTDAADNEDNYILERRQLPGGIFAIINGGNPLAGSTPATQTGGTMQFIDTSLAAATTYEYRLRARNVAGDSPAPFPTAQATTLSPAPTAEPVVTATPISNSAVDLSWSFPLTPTDPIGFKIYRKSAVDPAFALIRTTPDQSTTFTDNGLSSNTQYCYRVRAYNAAGDGPLSSPATGVCATTLPNPPAAPTALTATLLPPTSVRLDWTDNSQTPDEDGFKVEASTDSFNTQQNTSLSAAAAAGDATITVASATGIGAAKLLRVDNEIMFVTGVTGTTVSVLRGQLQSTAASHSASAIVRVGAVQLTAEAPQHVGTGAVSPGITISGLLNNTVYYFRVLSFARNMTGDSNSAPTTPACVITRPATPSNLAVVTPAAPAGASSLQVSWTDNNPKTNTASTFLVERAPESSPGSGTAGTFGTVSVVPTGVQGGAWSLTDTGLAANAKYFYRVSATNTRPAGCVDPNSGGASSVVGPTSGTTRPAAPTLSSVVEIAPTTSLRLTWADNSPVKTQIRIERATNAAFTTGVTTVNTASAGTTTWDDTSTAGNLTYYYRLTAFNAIGDSAPSAIVGKLTLPGQPLNLKAVASADPSVATRIQIKLTWTDGSAAPSAFKVEMSTKGASGPFSAVPGSPTAVGANSLTIGNLDPAVEYCFRVRGTNATGDGVNSTTACAPAGPAGLTASAISDTQIRLEWEDHSSTETGFLIERVQGVSFATGGTPTTVGTAPQDQTTYVDGGLTPNTTYTYRVTAVGDGGQSVPSREAGATTFRTAPAAANGLTATATSSSQIDLTWSDNSSNETGFIIERSPNGTGSWSQVGTAAQNATSFNNTGLSGNVTYYYRVTAVNVNVKSAPSNTANALTYPSTPSNLVATAIGSARIDLSWTDSSGAPSDFKIQRKTGQGGTYADVATTTAPANTYSDTGLQPGTTYYYQVRATNATGDSGNSNEANATTLPSKPTAPSGLQVTTVSQTSLRLTWTDSSNNETGFKIERSPNGTNGWRQIGTAGQDAVSYLDQGLLAETTYFYRVSATNAGGDSDPSSVASGTTLPNLALTPGNLTVTVPPAPDGSTKLVLKWTDTSSNESGFKIERSPDNFATPGTITLVVTTAPNATTYTDSGLTPDTIYYYRVRATNAAGDSANTSTASGRTLVAAPSAPSGLTVTALSSSSLKIDWTDNSNNEDSFKLERSTDGTNFGPIATPAANQTTYTDTGLTADTRYYYRVLATNAGGDSAPSNTDNARTLVAPPAAPSNLVATALSTSKIGLTWDDNSSNETGFRIERKISGGTFSAIQTVANNVRAFDDNGLTADTTYVYRVIAVNGGGDSVPSNEASAKTLPTPPAAPTGLTAAAQSQTQIKLTWTDASNNETGFKVERSTNGTTWNAVGTVATNVTIFTDSSLTAGTSYSYRVKATNAGGDSGESNVASATTFPLAPGAPSNLTATALSQTEVTLHWSAGTGVVTGFKIERKDEGGVFVQIATAGAGATSATDNGLTAGATYVYRIRATNAGGDSDYSNEATVKALPNLPTAPTNLTITVLSQTALKLNWSDNSSDETGFEIERTVGGGGQATAIHSPFAVGPNVTTYTDSDLTANTTYTYRIRSGNAGGLSAWSSPVTATTLPLTPAAPTGLTVTVQSASALVLNWTDKSNTETGFKIERRVGPSKTEPFNEVATVGENVTTWTDTDVQIGQTYAYRVLAFNSGGNSAASNEAAAQLSTSGKMQVSVRSINFGNSPVGKKKTKKFKIKNTGRTSLLGTVGALGAPFQVSAGTGTFSLAPGQSINVTVEFTPSTSGRVTQTLKITSTDPAQQTVNLPVAGNGKGNAR